jgi:plasmid stabilization system protein ParE
MAYRVVWSAKAVEDVEAIATYIARDSPSYAAAVVLKLLELAGSLAHCPQGGSAVSEFANSTIQEKFAYNYRLIYCINEGVVTVAAVIHSKRLLPVSHS